MPEILTGVRAKFSLNGVRVGYATNVSFRETIAMEGIKTLDNFHVLSHEPVDYDVTMSAAFIRIVADGLKAAGWLPKQGTSAEQHLRNVLNQGELVATLEDSKTGILMHHVEGVRITERSMQVSARGIVAFDVSMVAKLVRDEDDMDGSSPGA